MSTVHRPREDVWKERENDDVLAYVSLLVAVLYFCVCTSCVFILMCMEKWSASLLPFPRLELKRNRHRQRRVSYEFGDEGF